MTHRHTFTAQRKSRKIIFKISISIWNKKHDKNANFALKRKTSFKSSLRSQKRKLAEYIRYESFHRFVSLFLFRLVEKTQKKQLSVFYWGFLENNLIHFFLLKTSKEIFEIFSGNIEKFCNFSIFLLSHPMLAYQFSISFSVRERGQRRKGCVSFMDLFLEFRD